MFLRKEFISYLLRVSSDNSSWYMANQTYMQSHSPQSHMVSNKTTVFIVQAGTKTTKQPEEYKIKPHLIHASKTKQKCRVNFTQYFSLTTWQRFVWIWLIILMVLKVKGKVLPYSLPSVRPGADPSVQAVSPQVTISHPLAIGCHYFPPGLHFTFVSVHQMALPLTEVTDI